MKKICLLILMGIVALSVAGCSMSALIDGDDAVSADVEVQMVELSEWDTALYCFFYDYMAEPTSFGTYDDYYDIICYMLLNHIEYYEVCVEYPEYEEEVVHEIVSEMAEAYDEVALFLNTYTDFWSRFNGLCMQEVDSDGVVICYTYSFEFQQKDGLANEAVELEVEMAEAACFELIESMFDEGELHSDMNEKERAYVIYRWICTNVAYAYDAPATDSDEVKPDNCFSAMVDRYAVCQGITGAYVQLCRLAGVEMYIQLGYTDAGTHSWCKIVDEETGEWMYIDPTWGITSASGEEEYTDKWFWVSQGYMENYSGLERVFVTDLGEYK